MYMDVGYTSLPVPAGRRLHCQLTILCNFPVYTYNSSSDDQSNATSPDGACIAKYLAAYYPHACQVPANRFPCGQTTNGQTECKLYTQTWRPGRYQSTWGEEGTEQTRCLGVGAFVDRQETTNNARYPEYLRGSIAEGGRGSSVFVDAGLDWG
jgi:hypothetical protein